MPLNFFEEGAQALRGAQGLLTPNPSSLETASSRLTSRIAAQKRSDERAVSQKFAGVGRAGSGASNLATVQSRAGNTQALSTGLADLNEGFENRKLQAGQALADVGTRFGNLGQGQGTLGIQEQQLGLDRELGTGKLGLERELGVGRLGLEEKALAQSKEQNRVSQLLDFFNAFIEGGNLSAGARLPGRDQQFNSQLNLLLNSLFSGTKVPVAPRPPTVPVTPR